uniref:Uncharacterized protein n=1 Tax=Meloidogyne enterolobii TaxID=390850 RepID=A0A6V7VZU6_MELEN|nr:unnamed protein product [Meloidogyne enterolobii]
MSSSSRKVSADKNIRSCSYLSLALLLRILSADFFICSYPICSYVATDKNP